MPTLEGKLCRTLAGNGVAKSVQPSSQLLRWPPHCRPGSPPDAADQTSCAVVAWFFLGASKLTVFAQTSRQALRAKPNLQ